MKKTVIAFLTWLGGVSKTVAEFLTPIIVGGLSSALEQLLPVALEIVTEMATRNDLSGSQKRDQAVKRLQAEAIATGLRVGTSTLNLAVEMALAKLKEGK